MWINVLRLRILGRTRTVKPAAPRRPRKARLRVQGLETRLTPTVFNPASTAALITDIIAANTNGQAANTINLTGSGPYVLSSANNTTNGSNGLPVIGSRVASTLTINGNGNIIERESQSQFRFFDIAPGSGGVLILENIELKGGEVVGVGTSAEGGAIFNEGTLKLDGGVELINDVAQGLGFPVASAGNSGAGGGIYSSAGSTLKLDGNNLFESCIAAGGLGARGESGGSAFGGAIFANTTTASSLSSTAGTLIESCRAQGGSGGFASSNAAGGAGGAASGGGLFVNATTSTATATLSGFTFLNDLAQGGPGAFGSHSTHGTNGGNGGAASGGGLATSGGTVVDNSFILVQGCKAEGGSGGGGGTGTLGAGGAGGAGGNACGGGIFISGTTLTLAASPVIELNLAEGGSGGNGGQVSHQAKTGGSGGNSGTGSGGGLYATASGTVALILNQAQVLNNTAEDLQPGTGGLGLLGTSGRGGSYGGGFGGGLYLNQKASLTSDTIEHNAADGGFFGPSGAAPAGSAVRGASGGAGGLGAGGGLFVAGNSVAISRCYVDLNTAQGGYGGNTIEPGSGTPGVGGAARGAGVDIEGGTMTISSSQIENNTATAGDGGVLFTIPGGNKVGGSAGGEAAGGGLYTGGGTIHLTLDIIQNNGAFGGVGADGSGATASSSGGGLYVVSGTSIKLDSFSTADLVNNVDSNLDSSRNSGSGGAI